MSVANPGAATMAAHTDKPGSHPVGLFYNGGMPNVGEDLPVEHSSVGDTPTALGFAARPEYRESSQIPFLLFR